MGLYDDFFSLGVDDLFNAGQSFSSVAKFLRGEGLAFSDSRLRIFRDSVAQGKGFDLSEFSHDTPLKPEYLKPSNEIDCGKFAFAVSFEGHYQQTGKSVQGRTFEIIDDLGSINDFIDNYSEAIAERLADNSDIIVDSISVQQGYAGEC